MLCGYLSFNPQYSRPTRLGLAVGLGLAIAGGSSLGLSALAQATTTAAAPSTQTELQPRFDCQWNQSQYMVMYHPQSRPEEAFPWATPKTMGGGWSAERRCNEIGRRLEEYRPDGLLEMKTSQENGYNIVCVTTQNNPACRIVFTVPQGQDPTTTRNSVFQNLASADDGQQTQAVNTYVGTRQGSLGPLINMGLSILTGKQAGSSDAIQLRPFLDAADGGTGKALKNGIPVRSQQRLNPEQFR